MSNWCVWILLQLVFFFFFRLFIFSKFGYGFDGDAKNGDAMSEFVNVFLLISERALWTIMD